MAFTDFIKSNIAPYSAKKIGVYNDSGNRIGSIALGDFKPIYGERLYRFGLLSDVHNEESQATDNSADFINALNYFNNKEDVEFTVISGDLTQTSYSTRDLATEMQIYKTNKENASPNTPVYVTTGNHDCPNNGTDIDISTFYRYAGLSDIAPSSGCDYSYEVTKTHTTSNDETVTDHFLFLTMKQYQFSTATYSTNDITWLDNKLTQYSNDRCFVITHMFIPTYAGNLNSIYPSGNWLSGNMLSLVKHIVDSHTNAIWITGHSHWKWYLQKYQNRANLYPLSNANRSISWNLHVPSCAYPIDSDGATTRLPQSGQSEGCIVDVYKDYVDIRAIEFKGSGDTTYNTKYIPVAQYRLYTHPNEGIITGGTQTEFLATFDDWSNNPVKNNSAATLSNEVKVVSENENIITSLIFSSVTTGLIFTCGKHVQSGNSVTVSWGNLTIESPSGTTLSSIPTFAGWYDNTDVTEGNNYGYSLASPFTTIADTANANGNYGIQFNISSKFSGNTICNITNGVVFKFTNLKWSIEGYYGEDNSGSTSGETTIKNVLKATVSSTSSGLGIPVNDNSNYYVKYDGIKIVIKNSDVTSQITSVGSSSSNSYKLGIYTINSVYQYAPAGTVISAQTNTSTAYQIPLIQTSSSSSISSRNTAIIYLENIQYSKDGNNWISANENTTMRNGSEYGKNDVTFEWINDIE